MWECVGGSVTKGEGSLSGALREAKEEVGVELLTEMGHVVFSKVRGVINGRYFGDIMDVWIFEYEGLVSLENATTDKVAQTVWMTREQIRQLHNSGKLVHTLDYFFTTEGL